MAKPPAQQPAKAPVDEEAHFRIDELERKAEQHSEAVKGLAPALMALMGAEIDKRVAEALDKYKAQDRAEDRKLFAQLIAEYENQEEEITKNGTVETPDGVHRMTVTEIRRRKPPSRGPHVPE